MTRRNQTVKDSCPQPAFTQLYYETYKLIDHFRIQSFDNYAMHLEITPEVPSSKKRSRNRNGKNRGNGQLNGVLDPAQAMESTQARLMQPRRSQTTITQPAHAAQTPGPPAQIGLSLVQLLHPNQTPSSYPSVYAQELFKYEFDWTTSRTQYLYTHLNQDNHIVEVFVGKDWYPLTTYLSFEATRNTTNPNIDPNLTKEERRGDAYLLQQDWWYHNGKNFPILHLPPEIRDVIYSYCTGEYIEPYARDALRLFEGKAARPRNDMLSSLLKCHLKLSTEFRKHLFRHHSMLMTHPRFMIRTLGHRFFPRHELSHITLAFPSHRAWFKFFGYRGKGQDTRFWVNEYPHLQVGLLGRENLPRLKKLELVIADRETLGDTDWLDGGCQVKTVEMVLESVLPVVEGQPVVLAGMVKVEQKKRVEEWSREAMKKREGWVKNEEGKWIKKTEEVNEDDDEEGGVPIPKELDETAEKIRQAEAGRVVDKYAEEEVEDYDELAELPVVELPPVCRCDPHCLDGDWVE